MKWLGDWHDFSGAGSDLQAMRTSAILQGDHYVLNGSKPLSQNGQYADVVVLAGKLIRKLVPKGVFIIG